jgi:site-specific recombinase
VPSTPPNLIAQRLLEAVHTADSVDSLEALFSWVLEASPVLTGAEVPRTRRLLLVAEALEAHPRAREIRARVASLWTHDSAVRLLAETGLPVHTTLLRETVERLVDRVVPRLQTENDLHSLLSRLRLEEADAHWLEQLPPGVIAPWRSIFAIPRATILDAARLVALRATGFGLARELLAVEPGRPEAASPFFRLGEVVTRLAQQPDDSTGWAAWIEIQGAATASLTRAHAVLERRGVSTDLVFRLELLEAMLLRLDDLLLVATGWRDGRLLAEELVRGSMRQRGIRSLARNSLKRLAKKVTEHTAETGDLYVVRNRAEWEATARSAAGGGAVTALTALGKYALGALPLAPLVAGLGYTINYSASFIAMQLAHFTLASKQPAMTGAALATALEHGQAAREVELVAGITRSQVAATFGNVLTTMPVCALMAAVVRLVTGAPALSMETAEHSVHAVHPLLSLTIPFAILTGVLLWLSSLAAGWAANWSAYRGIPEATRRHRALRRLMGQDGARWAGDFVERNLSGMVGYLVLGFLLGFMPVAFTFAGLAVEVRHVTLQAASLMLAAGSLYGTEQFHWSDMAWGGAGIVVIGVCNFTVSFALAMRTAMRARGLGKTERGRLWAAIREAFLREPRRFLWRPA